MKLKSINITTVIIIIIAIIWIVFPIYYLFLTSVKPADSLFETPPRLITRPDFDTYDKIFIQERFFRFFQNSFIIASGATLLALLIGSLATFAFTQWKFRGREALYPMDRNSACTRCFSASSIPWMKLLFPVPIG